MIYQFVLPALYWLVLILCGIYVSRAGGPLERRTLLVIAALSILSLLVSIADENQFQSTRYGLLLLDMLLLTMLTHAALTSDRYWPIWAAGFHMVSVMTHLAVMAIPDLVPTAYALVQGFWIYPVLISVAMGARSVHKGWTPLPTKRAGKSIF